MITRKSAAVRNFLDDAVDNVAPGEHGITVRRQAEVDHLISGPKPARGKMPPLITTATVYLEYPRCVRRASSHVGIGMPSATIFEFDNAENRGRLALSLTSAVLIGVSSAVP